MGVSTCRPPQKHLEMYGIPTTAEGEAAAAHWVQTVLGSPPPPLMRHCTHVLTALTMARAAARGTPTGAHAAFVEFGVDAVTVSIPRAHPPGFHQHGLASALLGIVRCLNNVVERLHHSSTMYAVLGSTRVASIAVYSAATLPLVAAAAVVAAATVWRVQHGSKWLHGAAVLLVQTACMALLTAALWLMGAIGTWLPAAGLMVAAPAGPLAAALVALMIADGGFRVLVAAAAAGVAAAGRRCCFHEAADAARALYAALLCVVLGGGAAGNWGFALVVGAAVLPPCLLSL